MINMGRPERLGAAAGRSPDENHWSSDATNELWTADGCLYEIVTCWGSALCIDEDNTIGHDDQCTTATPLIAYFPKEWPGHTFLLSEEYNQGLQGFSFQGTANPPTFALGARKDCGGQTIVLVHPADGRLLAALPPEPGRSMGRIEANRKEVGPWEQFRLRAVADADVRLVNLASSLKPALHLPCGPVAVLRLLQNGRAHPWAVAACCHAMTRNERAFLAAQISTSTTLAAALAETFPEDLWSTDALPRLTDWRTGNSSTPQVTEICEKYDFLQHSGIDGKLPTLPAELNRLARENVFPTEHLCILATARNEGIYIIDWLSYHLAAGVSAFFIYTNDNDDDSDSLLEALAYHGIITLVRSAVGPSTLPQYKAYAHALQFLPEILSYRWTAVIDFDEYIRYNERCFDNVNSFLGQFESSRADSVGLSWRFHGGNGQGRWADRPVMSRFPLRFQAEDMHLKSVIAASRFSHSQCHFPFDVAGEPRTYVLANGRETGATPFSDSPNYDNAWVAHYAFKSAEEFLVRRLRNRGDGPVLEKAQAERISTGMAAGYNTYFRRADDTEDEISDALCSRVEAHRLRLLNLPGVAQMVEACKRRYIDEALAVRDLLRIEPRFNTPETPEANLLGLLGSRRSPIPENSK